MDLRLTQPLLAQQVMTPSPQAAAQPTGLPAALARSHGRAGSSSARQAGAEHVTARDDHTKRHTVSSPGAERSRR